MKLKNNILINQKLCRAYVQYNFFNSLFYFKNKIEFVGGMWNNLYDLS